MSQKVLKQCNLTDDLLERENDTTPDWLELKGIRNIPLFVFGQEKSGGKYHGYLSDSIFLGEARTCTSNFVMERTEYDGPVAFRTDPKVVGCRYLYGEVYLVHPKVILNLDMINCNNEMNKRERYHTYLLEQTIKDNLNLRPSLKPWMYLGREEFWESETTMKMEKTKMKIRGTDQEVYEWKTEQFIIPDFLLRRQF